MNYAQLKGIDLNAKHTGDAQLVDGNVVVPIFDLATCLPVGKQIISPDGTKRFNQGFQKKPSTGLIIGDETQRMIVAEGWATACAVQKFTKDQVVWALDAGHLPKTCEWLRERYPDRTIIVAADNDASGREAAIKSGLPYSCPTDRKDWDDELRASGLEATLNLFDGRLTFGSLGRALRRIELAKGKTAEAANVTIELMRDDPVLFDFGGKLARVSGGRVVPMCENLLANYLPSQIQYFAYETRGSTPVEVDRDPPPAMLKQIMAKGSDRKLKPLNAVITGPTVRKDGTVLSRAGYDTGLQLFLDPVGQAVPEILDKPTLVDAARALERLMLPFNDFPFVDASARGALLSAMLTASTRGIVPTAPAHAFDAPVQASGKTLLASCIAALESGRQPNVWPHTAGRDDEEIRKRLLAAVRVGTGALIWDNVIGTFDSASLAMFLTSPIYSDRILGSSETGSFPNRVMLLLTGNNLSLAGDLPRRVIICRIDPNSATPFDRSFDLDPLEYVLANRMEMLAAACTLIRARFLHWKKLADGKLASFEDWDLMVRQTVCFADTMLRPGYFGDPMLLVKEAQAADPEAELLGSLFTALHDKFEDGEFSAKDVQSAVSGDHYSTGLASVLRELVGDKGMTSSTSIGRVLKYRVGRIAKQMRLGSRHDKNAGSACYRIAQVTE